MKILLANKYFFLKGGSETVFFQEREFLIRQHHKIIDFSMEHPENFSSEYAEYFVPNTEYGQSLSTASLFKKLSIAINFIHNTKAIKDLVRLIEKEKPEIAHLHNIYHQLTPSIIPILKKHYIKVLLTLHDGKLICPSYLMFNKGRICEECQGRKFYKVVLNDCLESRAEEILLAAEAYWHKWRGSYDLVDLFLTPSKFFTDFITYYRIPKHKIIMLKNGIDTSLYSPTFNDGGYVLYIGRLSEEKGVKTLLKAHARVRNTIPLKIVGTGPLNNELLQNRFQHAVFSGYKSGTELIELVNNASFVVVPSECYENCSMVVLEAMALGKPVIGSSIGGIPEQIDDGKTGFLFEMGNGDELAEKIMLLAEHPDIRKKMGMAARKKIEQEYALEIHCKGLMNIYNQLLSTCF